MNCADFSIGGWRKKKLHKQTHTDHFPWHNMCMNAVLHLKMNWFRRQVCGWLQTSCIHRRILYSLSHSNKRNNSLMFAWFRFDRLKSQLTSFIELASCGKVPLYGIFHLNVCLFGFCSVFFLGWTWKLEIEIN